MRHEVFHAGKGGTLRLTRFTGLPGEIHLSVDAAEPFGLVNVGDAVSLFANLTRNLGFAGHEEVGGAADAQFDQVSRAGLPISILIGARNSLKGGIATAPLRCFS